MYGIAGLGRLSVLKELRIREYAWNADMLRLGIRETAFALGRRNCPETFRANRVPGAIGILPVWERPGEKECHVLKLVR